MPPVEPKHHVAALRLPVLLEVLGQAVIRTIEIGEFLVDRLLEAAMLHAGALVVVVVRECSLGRITQYGDQLHARELLLDQRRKITSRELADMAFAGDEPLLPRWPPREMRQVPGEAALGIGEVVHLLDHRRQHQRMARQVAVKRRRATFLDADDQELRRERFPAVVDSAEQAWLLLRTEHVRCGADHRCGFLELAESRQAVAGLQIILVIAVRQTHGCARARKRLPDRTVGHKALAEFLLVAVEVLVGQNVTQNAMAARIARMVRDAPAPLGQRALPVAFREQQFGAAQYGLKLAGRFCQLAVLCVHSHSPAFGMLLRARLNSACNSPGFWGVRGG